MQWHTPIGYKVINGKIEIWEEHRKLVEQIFTDYDNGVSAWRIADTLKKNGIKNTAGWMPVSQSQKTWERMREWSFYLRGLRNGTRPWK